MLNNCYLKKYVLTWKLIASGSNNNIQDNSIFEKQNSINSIFVGKTDQCPGSLFTESALRALLGSSAIILRVYISVRLMLEELVGMSKTAPVLSDLLYCTTSLGNPSCVSYETIISFMFTLYVRFSYILFSSAAVKCSKLPVTEPIVMNCSNPWGNFSYGSTCSFHCPEGQLLNGSERTACQENGQWSTTMPTCQGICLIQVRKSL